MDDQEYKNLAQRAFVMCQLMDKMQVDMRNTFNHEFIQIQEREKQIDELNDPLPF